jgi:hypothetical protein
LFALLIAALGVPAARAQEQEPAEKAKAGELPPPPPIPPFQLAPALPTTTVPRGTPLYNVQMVDASLLPRDKEGIWVLDFAFKPLRIITVEVGGKRKHIHYLYYRVINRTGKPRMFVPQFTLVADSGKRYEDTVLPIAVNIIQAREDRTIPLLGAVNIMGMIPASTKQGVDDAVFGVAIWEGIDPKADRLNIYVRGLSDGLQVINPPGGAKPVTRYKTLRIDFIRRGDERNLTEREIQFLEPPYEWIYW